MKTTIALLGILVFGLLPIDASAQITPNLRLDQLHDSVKSVDHYTTGYSLKFDQWKEEGKRHYSLVTYSRDGFLKEVQFFDGLGKPANRVAWTYAGLRVEGTEYEGKRATRKYTTIYDSLGNGIEEGEYDPNGVLLQKRIATVDSTGKVTWRTDYDGNGDRLRAVEYRYDSTGKMIWYRSRYFNFAQGDTTIDYQFDTNGLCTRETITFDFKGRGSDFWYDDHGNIVREEYYLRTNDHPRILQTTTLWEYEYDTHGNWTKRTVYREVEKFGVVQKEPVETTYRTIKYY